MSDYIDTRDLAEELDALEAAEELSSEETARANTLRELRNEIAEWGDGATLIPIWAFEEYARELADELGLLPDSSTWPLYCIDWEWAARELSHDYFEVELNGTTYKVRAS